MKTNQYKLDKQEKTREWKRRNKRRRTRRQTSL